MKKVFCLVICFSLIATACSKNTGESSTTTENTTESVTVATTVMDTTEEETVNGPTKLINPSEEYVISCLKNVDSIEMIEAATEEHDPNENLHKQGGYTSAVYFTISEIEIKADMQFGGYVAIVNDRTELIILDENGRVDSPVDLGTKCGGQIEVYATVEEALRRDVYLSGFDGTAFSSGSHIIVGSMIIRTSSLLRASQQQELTAKIEEALMNG